MRTSRTIIIYNQLTHEELENIIKLLLEHGITAEEKSIYE